MKRSLMFLLMAVVVAVGGIAKGQQPKKMARIGYLSPLSEPAGTPVAFKEGLAKLGWVEGKEIEIEYRYGGAILISFLSLRPSLFALKLMSSSRGLLAGRLTQRSVRRQRSPL
jgi:hypothetical protein